MSHNEMDNVVLFPAVKKTLEEESLKALQEKRYEEALLKLNHLIEYHASSHEIYIGKLMCLMELGEYQNAQGLCEELLGKKDEHYYHYLHIYLTVLFQTSQYPLLMEQVEYEFEENNVPELLREPFKQLYEMSQNMKVDIQKEYSSYHINELHQAINQDQHKKQWEIVKKLRTLNFTPTQDMFSLLENEHIHPVVKTCLLEWFIEMEVEEPITIHKFETGLLITPVELAHTNQSIDYHESIKELESQIGDNPTLQRLIQQLLYRYFYVTYPFTTVEEQIETFVNAAVKLGKRYLQLGLEDGKIDEPIEKMMDSIQMCDSLYLSIIEE